MLANLSSILKPASTPAAAYRQRIALTQWLRRFTQFAFVGVILYFAVTHHLATTDGETASLDALCPFGGIETLWQFITTGQYVSKTHQSNIVLLIALGMGTLISGGAFCGWVCPFGSAQDFMSWLRSKLQLKEINVPAWLDNILCYGRFVVLALVLYQTIATVKLWFANYDPYRMLFSLDWLFEFSTEAWIAYAIVISILGFSLLIERLWCRYLCPLGGLISLVSNFSFFRIKRDVATCKDCALCARPCPVKLPVDTATTISSNCIGCLECVDTCPRHDTLAVKLEPIWLPIKK